DHVKQQVIIIKTVFPEESSQSARQQFNDSQHRLDDLQQLVYKQHKVQTSFSLDPDQLYSNMSQNDFREKVKKTKEYIFEGDIFQLVLSQRFETHFEGDRFMLYRALRMVNPSPYLFYLEFDQMTLVGSSPEVLVRVQDQTATLLPIAGTRPRGETPDEDAALAHELSNDPKENAEHLMLVDLGRNDLSHVCQSGSVQPVRSRVIERYSHVMHIVTELQGTLSPQ